MTIKRPGKTTIWISDQMWIRLNRQKQKGDSMESVLDKFIPKVNLKFFKKNEKR